MLTNKRLSSEIPANVDAILDNFSTIYGNFSVGELKSVAEVMIQFFKTNREIMSGYQAITIAYLLSNPNKLEQEIINLKGNNYRTDTKEGIFEIALGLINTQFKGIHENLLQLLYDNNRIFEAVADEWATKYNETRQEVVNTKGLVQSIIFYQFKYLKQEHIQILLQHDSMKSKSKAEKWEIIIGIEKGVDRLYLMYGYWYHYSRTREFKLINELREIDLVRRIIEITIRDINKLKFIEGELLELLEKGFNEDCKSRAENERENLEFDRANVASGEQKGRNHSDGGAGIAVAIVTGDIGLGLIADALDD